MPLFFWKHNKEIDRFALLLADELFSTVPPELAATLFGIDVSSGNARLDKKAAKKVIKDEAKMSTALNASISKVVEFRSHLKLGVYGKARLHLQFMTRLQDLGYSNSLAKAINETVMLRTP